MSETSQFVKVCAVADLPDQGAVAVEVNGSPIAIVRTQGEVFAVRDVCSHDELTLSDGDVYDYTIECPAHGSCFDVRTGAVTQWPARDPVITYPAKVEDGHVLVSLTPNE